MSDNIVIFIPARYASARFPGKPLVQLRGASGTSKSLIRRSWEAAVAAEGVDAVYVLTDDERIEAAAKEFGADVLMTSSKCRNGTERCAEAVALLPSKPRIVVNLQGDAPLTPAWYVEGLVAAMLDDPDIAIATPVLHASAEHLRRLRQDRQAGRVGGTTAVLDRNRNALYFSKEVLPFTDRDFADGEPTGVYHHVGVYAYTPEALASYSALPPGDYEVREGLEQLRYVENGLPVRCVEVDARSREFWELNNPSDIATIEAIMKKEGLE